MCVLVVEDDTLIRMILVEDLTDAGYDVREAATGDDAMAMLKTLDCPLKIMVTDIHMPGQQDGLALGMHVRQHYPDVPVIYMTGRPDALQSLTTLGDKQALIRKPFETDEVVERIEVMLAA